jgi:chemotaxis protein histidine kinase CheA
MIKGNASLLDLKFFANQAHEYEDKISQIQDKKKIHSSDFVSLIEKLDEIQDTVSEVNDLIDRMSRIHDQFRPKRRFENELLIRSINNLIAQVSEDSNKKIKLNHKEFTVSDIPYNHRLLVKDLLIQLIRNCIAHGIEQPEERENINKNPIGEIELSSSISNGLLKIRVKDDGRGIQVEKLRQIALDLGKWDSEEVKTWNKEKVLELIFQPGISTTIDADLVSGRGVGMEAVQQKLIDHEGDIKINSVEGQFCEFIITLPMTPAKKMP